MSTLLTDWYKGRNDTFPLTLPNGQVMELRKPKGRDKEDITRKFPILDDPDPLQALQRVVELSVHVLKRYCVVPDMSSIDDQDIEDFLMEVMDGEDQDKVMLGMSEWMESGSYTQAGDGDDPGDGRPN